jgi:phosphatidylinositol-3-phosphatase
MASLPGVRAPVAAVLLVAAGALCACGASAAPATAPRARPAVHPCGRAGAPPAHYRHVVWIVMENKSYSQVMGSSHAPLTRSLAAACGVATRFHAETHPSLPNYLAMTSGSAHGVGDDAPPAAHRIQGPSIFSQLGAGWKALQESMPGACRRSSSGLYAVKHNPAAYYTNLARSCPRQDVRLTSRPDLSARFTFITPNLCHDTHDCGVGTGDSFLSRLVPSIVGSHEYRAGRMAVFITYDEDDGSPGNRIPTLVISPRTRPGTRSNVSFDHYSLLGTTEDMLGLGRLGAAAHAGSMRAAFNL